MIFIVKKSKDVLYTDSVLALFYSPKIILRNHILFRDLPQNNA